MIHRITSVSLNWDRIANTAWAVVWALTRHSRAISKPLLLPDYSSILCTSL